MILRLARSLKLRYCSNIEDASRITASLRLWILMQMTISLRKPFRVLGKVLRASLKTGSTLVFCVHVLIPLFKDNIWKLWLWLLCGKHKESYHVDIITEDDANKYIHAFLFSSLNTDTCSNTCYLASNSVKLQSGIQKSSFPAYNKPAHLQKLIFKFPKLSSLWARIIFCPPTNSISPNQSRSHLGNSATPWIPWVFLPWQAECFSYGVAAWDCLG